MKRLAVLRHAKSSWDHSHLDDFNRPLNARGWKAARRLGREMERRAMRFDLVIASTAARVRETIDGFRDDFDGQSEIRFERAMYLADAATLLSLVRGLEETVGAALLVGHNPGLQELLLALSHDDPTGLRKAVGERFPTAALAVLELPAAHWREVALASGKIGELILAKELD